MEESRKAHMVLVHGACHGAWSWFKLRPMLEAAGHRVTVLDLAASGIDSRQLQDDIRSMEDYTLPLLDLLASIPPPEEKVLLVGHSLGGVNLAVAMDKYPDRIAAAVFVAAFMPDSDHRPSYVLEQYGERIPAENWLDTNFSSIGTPKAPLTSMFFGPQFLSKKLYTLCSPQDVALGQMLMRPSSMFLDDLSKKEPFSKERFGSVKRVYILCKHDKAIPASFQQWQIDTFGVDKLFEIDDADHMPMLCTPQKLFLLLTQIANQYT